MCILCFYYLDTLKKKKQKNKNNIIYQQTAFKLLGSHITDMIEETQKLYHKKKLNEENERLKKKQFN